MDVLLDRKEKVAESGFIVNTTTELTEEEEKRRLYLERKVERAFYKAGRVLTELRDGRLYRSSHKTFEQYCRDKFGHSHQKSNYLVAAADVYENLTTPHCQNLEELLRHIIHKSFLPPELGRWRYCPSRFPIKSKRVRRRGKN